jgi:hypothetical protein
MSNKTIINYIVKGSRMYELPIITIYPLENYINIKIQFPNMEDINIKTNKNIIIKQEVTEPYPNMKLLANDKVIHTKPEFYNKGTITITSDHKFNYIESFTLYYDS